MEDLREFFRPEFLNRIDEVTVFRALGEQELVRIAELLLERTAGQLAEQGVRLEVSRAAVEWLCERGSAREFGARPLRRVIQRELDNRLASLLLDGSLTEGSEVLVEVLGGELSLHVSAARTGAGGRHAAEARRAPGVTA